VTPDTSDEETTSGEVVDKSEEVLFYEDIAHLLGFCDLFK
jgi:hypothetical protein